jgi:hypothetical protein
LALYKNYQAFIFSDASSPPLSQELARAINASLAEQLRTGDVGSIDWNYWTDAQDGEQSRKAKIASAVVERERAQVKLAYLFFPSPDRKPLSKHALISLSRTSQGCWVIEDVLRGDRSILTYLRTAQSVAAPPK